MDISNTLSARVPHSLRDSGKARRLRFASALLALAFCLASCDDFNRPLKPWIDEQYEKMKKIWDVSVSPQTAEVSPGGTRQFYAQVSVRADADQSVTWSVSGGSPGTGISAGGLLSVGTGETPGAALTVTAVSAFDAGKRASVPVTVRAPYAVTFAPAGGTWSGAAPEPSTVRVGESVNAPGAVLTAPSGGFVFAGWYAAAGGGSPVSFPYTPREPAGITAVTLYARWEYAAAVQSGAGWAQAVSAVNSAPGGSYAIGIAGGFSVGPAGDADNPTLAGGHNITIAGSGTISLTSNGRLLDLPSGVSVTLDGPALAGPSSGNTNPLVYIGSGSSFTLQNGSIRDNQRSAGTGGGVYVAGGIFTMSGGTISGNRAPLGGGAGVSSTGTFTMSGGTIAGNTASLNGGGVYASGTFALNTPATRNSVRNNTSAGSPPNAVYAGSGGITVDGVSSSGW